MNSPDPIKERREIAAKEETLEEKYEGLRLRTIFAEQLNSAGIDCTIAMDLDQQILYYNDACAATCALDDKYMVGKSFSSVFPVAAKHKAIPAAFIQVKKGFNVFVPSIPNMWIPGHFELHFVPLKNTAGEVTGILFIAHDVAHRVDAEQQLKELNRKLALRYQELERANTMLATFTHITGHQFKEPLRKIYSTLERVVMEEGTRLLPKGRNTIRKVQSSAQRLGLLADSLTTFSEAKQEMVEVVSLNSLMQQLLTDLKPQIREHEATIEVGPLPDIKGDHHQLKTLFLQLLTNAMKFQPPGNKPIVSVWSQVVLLNELPEEPEEKGDDFVRINIQDNGIGIPSEDRERIFQIFEKGTGEEKYRGAGLGLALARKIVENHGGYIRVGATPLEGGSIIMCDLPIIDGKMVAR